MSSEGLRQWRPAWLEVDLDAVQENVTAIRKHVGAEVKIYFVVKAMGYGHGAVEPARAALAAGADGLCVVTVEEARELRSAGVTCPVLLTGGLLPSEAEEIVGLDVAAVVYTEELARALSQAARRRNREIPLHLKVDTGMGRFGVPWDRAVEVGSRVQDLPAVRLQGLMTHFALSDHVDKSFTLLQTRRFRQVLEAFEQRGVSFECVHAANTGAILDLPETHFNMVRPGLAIYGVYPSPYVNRNVRLRPSMTLKARVVSLKLLPKGHSVSYGRRYVCNEPEWVAVLPIGYHDGYRRHMTNRGRVLLGDGSVAHVVGGVAMDATMIRVADPSIAPVGQEVILLGAVGNERVDAHELAEISGTVSYDILSGFSRRLPRVYLRGGRPWRVQTMLGAFPVLRESANRHSDVVTSTGERDDG